MLSPAVQRMIKQHNYPVLGREELGDYTQAHEATVLFFTENADAFPETNDVAMILPELARAFGERLTPVVVAPEDQRRLQKKYGFNQWPTLVFLRGSDYLGAISRVQDWEVYLSEVERILAAEPSEPPQLKLPASMQRLRANKPGD